MGDVTWICETCREPNAMCATTCVNCGSPVPVPTIIEAGALRIQVAQLRKERDEARAAGAAEERGRVVAYLRWHSDMQAKVDDPLAPGIGFLLAQFADWFRDARHIDFHHRDREPGT